MTIQKTPPTRTSITAFIFWPLPSAFWKRFFMCWKRSALSTTRRPLWWQLSKWGFLWCSSSRCCSKRINLRRKNSLRLSSALSPSRGCILTKIKSHLSKPQAILLQSSLDDFAAQNQGIFKLFKKQKMPWRIAPSGHYHFSVVLSRLLRFCCFSLGRLFSRFIGLGWKII